MTPDLMSCAMQFEHCFGIHGWKTSPFNDEFVLRVRDCQDLNACMSCMSVQCLVLNFVSADCAANGCNKNIVQRLLISCVSRSRLLFFLVSTSTNHNARNRNPEMVIGRTERNLHSHMAEFIKLVNGYNTFPTGTIKTDKNLKKQCKRLSSFSCSALSCSSLIGW